MKKTIGIIGGMGPLATSDLFRKIIDITDASNDQDHVRVCIDNNTCIPDRTAAILYKGEDPVPEIVKSALRLQGMGADVLIMPCNTAHYFYDQITRFTDIPLINMPYETARAIRRRNIGTVGLLATDGTCRSGVYDKVLSEEGIKVIYPDAKDQQSVMDLIYKGVKAGNMSIDLSGFFRTMDHLFEKGAQLLILGCTELPVAFDLFHIDKKAIDPTLVLAAAAVRFAGGKIKKEYGDKI